MGNTFRTVLTAFLSVVITPLLRAEALAKDALPQDVREAFEWYETLDYPDLAKARWIGVLPGDEYDGNAANQHPTLAFLLNDDGDKFTVLTPDLWRRTYTRKSGGPVDERVRWQARSLEADARVLLALARQELERPGTIHSTELETWAGVGFLRIRLPLRAMLFVMAHACYEHRLTTLTAEMCADAKRLPIAGVDRVDADDLRGKMQFEFGRLAMWNLIEAVGGIEGRNRWSSRAPQNLYHLPSRKELLTRFRHYVDHYPGTEYIPLARDTAAMLERMNAEDEAHPVISEKALAKLPVEEQVRELIFRLRDQNGHQMLQPGDCSVFNDYDGDLGGNTGNTPAHRLVEIGLPAVPQLLAALDDDRLSRTVYFWRDFTFSHDVLTVGQCAYATLTRIAGRRFYEAMRPRQAEAIAKVRAEISDWWQAATAKSEKDYYLDCITGTGNLDRLLSKLQAKWPEEVVGALMAGAEQAKEDHFRCQCVEHLAKRKDDRVTPFLFKMLGEGSTGTVRLAAAQTLSQRKVNDDRIAAALLKVVREGNSEYLRVEAFSALRDLKNPDALAALLQVWSKWPISGESSSLSDFTSLLSALLWEPTEDVVRTVAAAMPLRSVEERVAMVRMFGALLSLPSTREGKHKEVSPEVRRVAENALQRSLEDADVMLQEVGWGGARSSNHTVGDFALLALHHYAPKRYPCTEKADRHQREIERLAAANQSRKRQGLAELSLPKPPDKPLPPEQAMRIVAVRIAPRLPLPDIFRTEIGKLLGKDFKIESLTAILALFSEANWPNLPCLAFDVRREPDLTGVVIDVGGASGPNAHTGWRFFADGKVGNSSVLEDPYPYSDSKQPILNGPINLNSDKTSLCNPLWLDSYFAPGRAALEKASPTDAIDIQIAVERPTVFYPEVERVLPGPSVPEPDFAPPTLHPDLGPKK